MTQERYNGWANYETWLVNLWIDNEQGLQERYREFTAHSIALNSGDARVAAADLSVDIRIDIEEIAADQVGTVGMVTDLLNASLSRVDWYEIAEHMVTEAQTE